MLFWFKRGLAHFPVLIFPIFQLNITMIKASFGIKEISYQNKLIRSTKHNYNLIVVVDTRVVRYYKTIFLLKCY